MKKGFVIAIDGPAASGKGTIVQLLTVYLHGINIYTGGMYRALALKCIESHIDLTDESQVITVLKDSDINLGNETELGVIAKVFLDGRDVTQSIRTPAVALGAGPVAQLQSVRDLMVARQQALVTYFVEKGKTVILDGQDIALYVYPDADLKLFLTASQEVRAKRRQHQYEKEGLTKTVAEMHAEIQQRDELDFHRLVHPLSMDPTHDGYVIVDSSELTEGETLHTIVKELEKRKIV